ncbi:hypothetical protein C2845_PM05G20140 [Panicum miliaceum]|uniref:Uncharacterized protein n=1 Tax=Panicum miliaceum TaxID=4540 RepID=A0A3L6SZU8_PANMI|nr:hypothetical protein C2845_PM05G20140 [Panicum miliaceum]
MAAEIANAPSAAVVAPAPELAYNKKWAEEWFMVANPTPGLTPRTGLPPVPNAKWEEKPTEEEMVQVEVLLAELQELKAKKLAGATVALSFAKWLTQPIQERVHPGYEYSGHDDPTRVQNRKVSCNEAFNRVSFIVNGEEKIAEFWCPTPQPEGQQRKAMDPPTGLVLSGANGGRFSFDSSIGCELDDIVEVTGPAAEDNLQAEKAKNAKLQEELAALKASHRDAMIDEQRKHDLAIRKIKDLIAQKEKYTRIERALTDLKCDIYELTEEKEQLKKALEDLQLKYSDLDEEYKTVVRQLKDAEKQLRMDMQWIQSMGRDKQRQGKEMNQHATAAHQLCEFVDPTPDGRSLVQRLVDATTSIAGYASGTAKVVLTHALAMVKLCFPGMDVRPFTEGVYGECTKEQFNEYHGEAQDVTHQIVDDLLLF